jgi:hypothetical protein
VTWRRIVVVLFAVTGIAVWAAGLAAYHARIGYFAPIFSPDGRTIYALRRTTSAVALGFGYEFFTPPAHVFVRDDRHALIAISSGSGDVTELARFPSSPLAGQHLRAYRNALMGSPSAHLRWSDGRLELEVAVTRHDQPLSRTFTLRSAFDPATRQLTTTPQWQEAYSAAGGSEPEQLSGPLEVIAVPGDAGFPCAVATVHRDTGAVRTLVSTAQCESKFPAGITRADIASLERRPDIERSMTIERTYRELVAQGVAAGDTEGEAMLKAGRAMERLGYFPRSPTLSATAVQCDDNGARDATAGDGVFVIPEEEFKVGLFPDIDAAIASPGEEVDKGQGPYILHSGYDTSRRLNEYLAAGHTSFVVRRGRGCWRMEIR